MPKIDIGAVLRQKAPRLARWIPRPVVNWLRRTIHESEINHILEHYWSLPPQEFIRACFREWQVTYSVEGLEKLDPKGRYLFASNHPFGGMDGMMLADKLIDRFGPLPRPAAELLNVVRLRWEAVRLGMERVKVKNGLMIVHFVGDDDSPYYKSDTFMELLRKVTQRPDRFVLKQHNNRLAMTVRGIKDVAAGYEVLKSL